MRRCFLKWSGHQHTKPHKTAKNRCQVVPIFLNKFIKTSESPSFWPDLNYLVYSITRVFVRSGSILYNTAVSSQLSLLCGRTGKIINKICVNRLFLTEAFGDCKNYRFEFFLMKYSKIILSIRWINRRVSRRRNGQCIHLSTVINWITKDFF